jgi:hypothetical protein
MKLLLPLVALMAISCANVSVDEPSICDSKSLTSLPSVPVGVTVPSGISTPPISFSQQLELSGTLSKINSVADDVSVTVNQLVLDNTTGSLAWVQYVEVDIATDGMPSQPVVKFSPPPGSMNGSSIDLPVLMDPSTLYSYLSAGPVTLTFTLSGSVPTQTPELTGTMCVSASASKSVSL